ncbi:ras GTPase-activating protein-binding protein 1-like isoform X2 [Rhopilema esculentum]|uniref:ras GTPase-activating protein-binding protein 1-like isoform X2 n=1 Tax=Rhopilema esculentum TaxID=499914 RepID=UPI0031D1C429|eukprot:gene52-9658_t
MVMATTFTPQYIGREFVRQYYTMLYKDPTQLHRFYMKHSLFTHANLPNRPFEPVVGQEAIHNKIMDLNFRDCYSKIKSVDSQRTSNDGVVVQVAGELSNRGMPMRKFTQTFVLEAEAPQRFYVFNDIFRYQDDEIEYEEQTDENAVDYCSADDEETKDEVVTSVFEQPALPSETASIEEAGLISEAADHFDSETSIPQSFTNGSHHHMEEEQVVDDTAGHFTTEVKDASQPHLDSEASNEDIAPQDNSIYQEVASEEEKPDAVTSETVSEDVMLYESNEPEGPAKPVTWAALAKKNTPATSPPSANASVSRPVVVKPQTSPQTAPLPQRSQRRREELPRKEVRDDGRRKFSGAPPDNHQIFIGNLPNNITEADVREIFQEYGNIVEVRLNPKNFGFVAFDAPEPAEKILKKEKPILFGKVTINVEEKRASGSVLSRGGPRRDFIGKARNDSGPRNGAVGGRQGQPPANRDRPRGGQAGQQKPRGGMNTGEGRSDNTRGQKNRERAGPVRR